MFHKALLTLLLTTIFARQLSLQNDRPVKLNWTAHFKAKPDNDSKFSARTALIFKYSYQATISRNNLTLTFDFYADVNPEKSWVKKDKINEKSGSEALLNHEQGHVNINYLLMRETEKQLKSARYTTQNYKKKIQKTAAHIYAEFEEMQKKYDTETEHGINKKQQEEWDALIKSKFEALPTAL